MNVTIPSQNQSAAQMASLATFKINVDEASVTVVDQDDLLHALNFERLITAASTEANCLDFGDEDFFIPLRKLLEFCSEELLFRPFGLRVFEADLRRMLVNRLLYRRDVLSHPEILDEDVSDPLVITGMPRSGTTKLQRVISADPNVQALLTWKIHYPAPIRNSPPGGPDPRIELAAALVGDMASTRSSHEHLAEGADEDLFLLLQSFDFFRQVVLTPTHGYLRWVRKRPRATAYNFEKKMLQYLQWQDGGKRNRRWVLKAPAHMGALDVVTDVFPKAAILYAHRNIREVFASYCHMMNMQWQEKYANITPEWVALHAFELWEPELARFKRVRESMGDRLNIMEIPYKRVVSEPVVVAEEFYARAGLRLTAEGRAAMENWANENPQHRHGKVEYSLEKFGVDVSMIQRHLPDI